MSASENASRAEEQPRKRIKLEAFSEQDISKLGNVILGYSGHGNPVKKNTQDQNVMTVCDFKLSILILSDLHHDFLPREVVSHDSHVTG